MITNNKLKLNLFSFIFFNGIIFLLLGFFVGNYWESNDDVGMMLIASGKYTSKPSEFLVFQNAIIGFFFKMVYTISPKIAWYSWFTILSYLLSLSVISHQLYKKIKNYSFFFIILFYLFYVGKIIIVSQFTTVAALYFIAASSILFVENNSNKKWYALLAIIFFSLAALIRFEVFAMLAAVLGVFIAFDIFSKKYYNAKIFAIAIVLGFAFKWFNGYYYNNSAGWLDYQTFNYYRAFLQDAKVDYNINKAVIDKVGWTKNDFEVFTSFMGDYSKKYSIENLKFLKENLIISKESIVAAVIGLKVFLVSVLFAAIAVFAILKNKKNKLLVAASLLAVFFLSVLITYIGLTLKSRVSVSLKMFLFVLIVFCISIEEIKNLNKKFFLGSISILLVYAAAHAYTGGMFSILKRNKAKAIEDLAKYKSLKNIEQAGSLVINYPNNIVIENISIFDFEKTAVSPNQIEIGWLANSPLNKDKYKRLGFNANSIWSDAIQSRKFIYAGLDGNVLKPITQQFFKENYKREFSFSKDSTKVNTNDFVYSLNASFSN